MKKLETLAGLARDLPFEVNVWKAQNNYYRLLHTVFAQRMDGANRTWVEHFAALGKNLAVKVDLPPMTEMPRAS